MEVTLSYKSKQFCKGAPGRFVYTGMYLVFVALLHREGWFIELVSIYIDWLLLWFYVQAAIFQLYSDDEHEMDDKMNMKWWWNEKKGMGHKDNRVEKFWLPREKGRDGKGRAI